MSAKIDIRSAQNCSSPIFTFLVSKIFLFQCNSYRAVDEESPQYDHSEKQRACCTDHLNIQSDIQKRYINKYAQCNISSNINVHIMLYSGFVKVCVPHVGCVLPQFSTQYGLCSSQHLNKNFKALHILSKNALFIMSQ